MRTYVYTRWHPGRGRSSMLANPSVRLRKAVIGNVVGFNADRVLDDLSGAVAVVRQLVGGMIGLLAKGISAVATR